MAKRHHQSHDHAAHHRSRRRRRIAMIAIITAIMFVVSYTAIIYWFTEDVPQEIEKETQTAALHHLPPV
jgi:Co/Zn/Cd efflux system component